MRINNNIMAMNTHRQYSINTASVAKSTEKLSSGYRINRAGDDAAGLAISEKMRSQIRGLTMASKNSSDAISLVGTAEGALQETHNILQRMRELAVQSASDTNETSVDRDALNKEFQALIAEIDDTANKTKFNDMGLIDGSFAAKTMSYDPANIIPAGIGVSVANAMVGAQDVSANYVAKVPGSVTPATAPTADLTNIVGTNVAFSANTSLGSKINGVESQAIQVLQEAGTTNVTLSITVAGKTYTTGPTNIGGTTGQTKTFSFQGLGDLSFELDSDVTTDTEAQTAAGIFAGKSITFDGGKNAVSSPEQEAYIELSSGGETVKVKAGDTHAKFSNGVVLSFEKLGTIKDDAGIFEGGFSLTVTEKQGKPLVVQTGANQYDELRINIDRMDAETLGVKFSSVALREDASKAITEVNDAVNKVSTQRAALGALQNRLQHKINNLDTSAENLSAAESRIRDLDMAKEMTNFTKNNILVQASTAMLAQANAAPQGVLQLLQ